MLSVLFALLECPLTAWEGAQKLTLLNVSSRPIALIPCAISWVAVRCVLPDLSMKRFWASSMRRNWIRSIDCEGMVSCKTKGLARTRKNARLEKKALSPVGSGQAKGPTLSIRAPFARRVRRHGLFPGYLPRLGKKIHAGLPRRGKWNWLLYPFYCLPYITTRGQVMWLV